MAVTTRCRVLIGLMIRVGGPVVIGKVTIKADCGQPIVNAARVTLVATRLYVLSRQREAGVVVIVV